MKKKILAVLLAVGLCVSALGGCAGENSTRGPESAGIPGMKIHGKTVGYGQTLTSVNRKLSAMLEEGFSTKSLTIYTLAQDTRIVFRENAQTGESLVAAWMTQDDGVGTEFVQVGDNEAEIQKAYPECEDELPYLWADSASGASGRSRARYKMYMDADGKRIALDAYYKQLKEATQNGTRGEFEKKYCIFLLIEVEQGRVVSISCGDTDALIYMR